jgi:Protein of unknown function (DUF3533)
MEEGEACGAPGEQPPASLPRFSEASELAETIMEHAEVVTKPADVPHLSLLEPEQRHLVLLLFKALVGSSLLLSTVFIILLLLFFGSGWNPAWYYWRVKIGYVDLDGGLVGAALQAVASSGKVPFTLVNLSGSSFDSVKSAVDTGRLNAAWIAMPGATAQLLAAAASPMAPYSSAGALSFVYDEGRGGASMASLLTGATTNAVSAMSAIVTGTMLHQAAVMNASASALNVGVLVAPVSATTVNLHPVRHAGEHTAVGLAFIDYWIITLIATNINLKLGQLLEQKGVRRDEQVGFRIVFEFLVTGFLALWPPVVLAGLGSPSAADQAGISARQFFAWWAWVWLCLISFGSIITFLLRNFGEAVGNLLHTTFLILNLVSGTGVNAMELMHPFFRIGLGLPYCQAVQGSRTIIFGSYNRIRRNAGILIGWSAACIGFGLYKRHLFREELRRAGYLK